MKKQIELKKLVLSSILVALAIVFEVITDYVPGLNLEMPNGGNIFGISMLPLILIGVSCGWYYGIVGGLFFGLINWLISGHDITAWSWLLDYILPGGVLGLGFVFNRKRNLLRYILSFVLCCLLRYLILSLSGVILWGMYAPEGTNAWFYSFVLYNGPYMLVSSAITIALGIGIYLPYTRLLRRFLPNTYDPSFGEEETV
jgi:thiamine transporter